MPSESSLKLYNYYINRFYDPKKIKKPKKFLTEISELKNRKGEEITVSTMKLIMCAIIWKLKTDKKNIKIIDQFSRYIKELKKKANEQEVDPNKYEGNIPKWEDIEKIRDETKEPLNHLILCMYTMIAPRRLLDYTVLKVAMNKKEKLNKSFNYYDYKDKTITFNVFKTSKSMNSQTFVIPPELSKIIDKYIKDNKLKNGDLLFGFHSTLQLLYRLKKLLGCGVDNIRHSYINYRYSKYNLPPSKEMEEMANQLGHSLTTDLRYRKNT